MFIEMLLHLAAFDAAWFVNLVLNNLFWVMGFASIGYFYYKKPIVGGAMFALYLYALIDFANILGWVFRLDNLFVPVMVFLVSHIFLGHLLGKYVWYTSNKFRTTIVFYLIFIWVNVMVA